MALTPQSAVYSNIHYTNRAKTEIFQGKPMLMRRGQIHLYLMNWQ